MTAPAPTNSNGASLKMGATATPTNVIGGITGFKGPSGSATVINATTLADTAKIKLMGLPDEGQFTFDINFDPADSTGQATVIAARSSRTLQYFELDFAGGTHKATWTGYVTGFAIQGAVDALLTGSVTVEITGAVTYA